MKTQVISDDTTHSDGSPARTDVYRLYDEKGECIARNVPFAVLRDAALAWFKPEPETVRVCAHCEGEITQIGRPGDTLDYCEQCECIEGPTKEIPV